MVPDLFAVHEDIMRWLLFTLASMWSGAAVALGWRYKKHPPDLDRKTRQRYVAIGMLGATLVVVALIGALFQKLGQPITWVTPTGLAGIILLMATVFRIALVPDSPNPPDGKHKRKTD